MRRFRFPLQRLLRLRSHDERLARRALALALAEVDLLQRRLDLVRADLDTCREQGAELAPHAHLARALEKGFSTQQRALGHQLRAATARLTEARQAHRDKRRQLRSLERLHERRRAEWEREVAAAEQSELDELARLRDLRSVQGRGIA